MADHLGHGHGHGHEHHDHDAHSLGQDHLGATLSRGEPSASEGFAHTAWRIIKAYHLLTVAFLVLVVLAYVRVKRRRQRAEAPQTNYVKEHDMNLSIRRARALEQMQAEYDRKAAEFEELQAARRKLEAEERAKRVSSAAPATGAGGGGGGPSSAAGGGGNDWSPLMGSGPVGGFKSQRCVKRGG